MKWLAKCSFIDLSGVIVGLNVNSPQSFQLCDTCRACMSRSRHTDTLNAFMDKKKENSLALLQSPIQRYPHIGARPPAEASIPKKPQWAESHPDKRGTALLRCTMDEMLSGRCELDVPRLPEIINYGKYTKSFLLRSRKRFGNMIWLNWCWRALCVLWLAKG